MSTPIGIVVAGALIATSILIVGHWHIGIVGQANLVVRLNAWTGTVAMCQVTANRPGAPIECSDAWADFKPAQ